MKGLINKVKNLRRQSRAGPPPAEATTTAAAPADAAAPAGTTANPVAAGATTASPVTITLARRTPGTIAAKAAAAVQDVAAATSEKEALALANAAFKQLRVKYHAQFDHFKVNTGKAHPRDQRGAEAVSAAADVGASGQEPLTDQQGELLWTGQVSVGTPPQVFNLDFDTGSSDTWVNPNLYNPTASSTAKRTGQTFRVAYGDGSQASGDIYQETLTVGGATATNQAFGNATKSTLQQSGNDQGIAGMAFESIAQFRSPPFFQTLYAQGAVPQNLFAFGLWTEGARLDLGQIVDTAYQGEITYSPVDQTEGFWTTNFEVTGASGTQTGIIDTGTTLILGPTDVVRQIYNTLGVQVQEQDGQVYGVYDSNNPPSISLTFNGVPFTISPDALSFQVQGSQTIAGLIGGDIGAGPSWIVGDTFLQDVYAVFDIGNSQVGFAPKATSTTAAAAAAATTAPATSS